MVPVPSQCVVDGKNLTDLLDKQEIGELVEKTSNGGAEIVELLKTGSAYFAPASAAAQMVNAIITDSKEILPDPITMEAQNSVTGTFEALRIYPTSCRLRR